MRTLDARGPSPRTWGTSLWHWADWGFVRSIPTHVGNFSAGMGLSGLLSVHPHARGELFGWYGLVRAPFGPSPRTWGTCTPGRFRHHHRRSIPTHVGNLTSGSGRRLTSTVHPHARGELGGLHDPAHGTNGPSPRTWGTCLAEGRERLRERSIPTHVGNLSGERVNNV